jgi:hypothetical protein
MARRFLDHGAFILAAVALLLLAVMSSPIRPTSASNTAPSPNYISRSFLKKIGHSGRFALSARLSWRDADSLRSDIEDELDVDIEDELTVTSPLASVFFDVLPSPSPKPYSELVSFAVPFAARPLRC